MEKIGSSREDTQTMRSSWKQDRGARGAKGAGIGLTAQRNSERTSPRPRRTRCQRGCVGSSQADPRASTSHSHAGPTALLETRTVSGLQADDAENKTLGCGAPLSDGRVRMLTVRASGLHRSEEGLPGPAERRGACGRRPY